MYNVLIVDDDKLIREDIGTLIEWQEYGFEVVGEANNGLEAIDFINSNRVDIVITDIYMPILGGIELIKSVKAGKPDIKFLVISNYDDFSYVKEAMKLGASDYILKFEIEKDNLISLLKNLKQEAENEKSRKTAINSALVMGEKARAYLIEQFWRKVLEGELQKDKMEEQAVRLDINIREGSYILLLVELFPKEIEMSSIESAKHNKIVFEFPDEARKALVGIKMYYIIPFDENKWALLLNYSEKSLAFLRNAGLMAANSLKEIIIAGNEFETVITLGKIGSSVYELPASFMKAKLAADDKFYIGLDTIIDSMNFREFSNELDDDFIHSCKKKVLHDISTADKDGAVRDINDLFKQILEKRYYPELIYNSFIDLQMGFGRELKKKGIIGINNVYKSNVIPDTRFNNFITLKSIRNYFIQIVENMLRLISGIALQPKRPETIKALELISRSYMNDLTLNDAAEYVGLSKNYFCKLFKEEMGENFIDYINRFRIEKAKFIIENENCKILEVACKVGIKDYRYFCKLFKQITGKRPNEHKKRVQTLSKTL